MNLARLLVISVLLFEAVSSGKTPEYIFDYESETHSTKKPTAQIKSIASISAKPVAKAATAAATTTNSESPTLPPVPPISSLFQTKPNTVLELTNNCSDKDCGDPLFLTPYLLQKDIDTAVTLSKVTDHPLLQKVKSYSGFFTVHNASNSNIFFWFFPALNSETSSPLIVWLQGGPGQSGLYAIFNLHGPFAINEALEVELREHTWAQSVNVLYLDNPFGVGFSFTEDDKRYPRNQEQVAEYLYDALNQFFTLFPDYTDDHIYICGEGYGAKFAVSLAHKIHAMGRDSIFNLKGVALGNPNLDQEVFTHHGQYLYEMGLLDEEELHEVTSRLHIANSNAHQNKFADAMDNMEHVFGSLYTMPIDKKVYLPTLTGIPDIQNILEPQVPDHFERYLKFIQQPDVRKAIHVGQRNFQSGVLSYQHLREDIPLSVKNLLTILLDNYRVLFYGGNLDAIVPYSIAVKILDKIHWKHLNDYKNSSRMIWHVERQDREAAGYVHHVKNFFEVMIRNCGHAVAYDQPKAALDMMNRFIWGRAFIVNQRF